MPERPVLGAAMPIGEIGRHRDWLIERDRPLEIQDFCLPMVLDADWRPLIDLAKRKLDGWSGPLGIHGPFYDLPLDATDPEARALVQRRYGQGLDVAEALGATMMVIHSPFSTWGAQNDFLAPKGREHVIERVEATLRPLLGRAEAAGITLVIENVEDEDAEHRAAIVDALGSAALGVSLDTGHAHYVHVSRGGRPVDWHVIGAGSRLAHVHLQDADGYADRHWPPGMGAVPFAPVFAALAAHAPAARLILEMADPSTILPGARWLTERGLAV